MIFHWHGKGYLGLLIPIAIGLAADLGADRVMGSGWYQAHSWAASTVLAISALCVWIVGSKLNSVSSRAVLEPDAGAVVSHKKEHKLLWMPMEWFSLFLLGIAAFNLKF